MVQIKLKLVSVILAVAVVSLAPTGTSALPLPGRNDHSSQDNHNVFDVIAQAINKFVPATPKPEPAAETAPSQGTVRPAE